MLNQSATSAAHETVGLDETLKKIKHWRENKDKSDSRGIPDDIWTMIFQLEGDVFDDKILRRIFSLNKTQYHKKQNELLGKIDTKKNENNRLSEVKIQKTDEAQFSQACLLDKKTLTSIPSLTQFAESNKKTIKKLKSTNMTIEECLDTTTVIVECIRDDGHRLKIHTTNNRLDIIMKNFFNKEAIND